MSLRCVNHQVEYENRGERYHPSTPPGTAQFNPTLALVPNWDRIGSKFRSEIELNREEKGEEESQHVKVPVLQLCPAGGLVLRTGVAEAVTVLAKAMAPTKETRDL